MNPVKCKWQKVYAIYVKNLFYLLLIKKYIECNEIQYYDSEENFAKKNNVKYWKSTYFISWNTNLNSIALKFRNFYSTEWESNQFDGSEGN